MYRSTAGWRRSCFWPPNVSGRIGLCAAMRSGACICSSCGFLFRFAGVAARRAATGSLKLPVLRGWIYMFYKTSTGELIRLPFLGELAERSVAEQSSGRP